jgi:tripartite-type tricarboxylate transporter receptor subunit TctC
MALLAATSAASAQDWPTRPMTLVVPLAAGGSSDAIARIVSDGLRAELGQPVLVENVSGAGGMLGSSRVAKARPDGYQFVLGNVGTHAQNQSVYRKPLYNVATDFTPVVGATSQGWKFTFQTTYGASERRRATCNESVDTPTARRSITLP